MIKNLNMESSSKIIFGIDNDVKQNLDSNLQKFFGICKHYMNLDPLLMKEPDNVVRECFRFFHYKFPSNISEHFFRCEEAPLLWICDSPLNLYIKDFYNHHFPIFNGVDQYRTIKELYTKWITNKQPNEKKYFANSIINFVENYNSRSNFLSNIFGGIVFSIEESLYNPEKSIDLFNKSKEIISKIKLSDNAKEELEYLLTLFTGYSYLTQENYEYAKDKFEDALKLKPSGITAKFHLAVVEMKLENIEAVENRMKEMAFKKSRRI